MVKSFQVQKTRLGRNKSHRMVCVHHPLSKCKQESQAKRALSFNPGQVSHFQMGICSGGFWWTPEHQRGKGQPQCHTARIRKSVVEQ